jgi:cell division protein FtsB
MGISRKARKDLALGIVILTVIGFSFYMILGHGGYMKLREARTELSRLKDENHRLRHSQQAMMERINKLKTDPHEIERIAGEHYQLAKPGDIIVNTPE